MAEAIRALQDRRPDHSSKLASSAPPDDRGDPRPRGNQEQDEAAGPDTQTPLNVTDDP
jgi:hypothetical protein